MPTRHPTRRDRLVNMLKSDVGAWCVLFIGLIALLTLTPPPQLATGSETDRPAEVRFTEGPTWAGDSLLEHLASVAARQFHDAGGRDELIAIHDALARSGWFDSVRTVRRLADGAIEVDASFLIPVAVVQDQYGDVMVDAKGRTLPDGASVSSDHHVIHIINAQANRPSRPARPWQGDDMAAGLDLHRRLTGHPWSHQIEAIDLSQYDRSGALMLITGPHARIRWGSAPGEETPLETLADRKIVRLGEAFRTHGRVDYNHQGLIDLTVASHVINR